MSEICEVDTKQIEEAIKIYEKVFETTNSKYSSIQTWKDRNLWKIYILENLAFLAIEKRQDSFHIWLMGSLKTGLGTKLFQYLCNDMQAQHISTITVSTYPNKWKTMYSWLNKIGFKEYKVQGDKIWMQISAQRFSSYFEHKARSEFEKDMILTSFDHWYPIFSHHSPPSKFFKIPDDFIAYLQQDGIILPRSIRTRKEDSDDEEEEDVPEFEKIQSFIKETIKEYKIVFPKVNWGAPRDAVWILPENILKCDTVEEVFLALKSSEIVQYDLQEQVENDKILVLKKWINVDPTMEFRLFVNETLMGISQRDCTAVYPSLAKSKKEIEGILVDFWESEIKDSVDLYLCGKTVFIIDFNVWGPPTEGLLFDWEDMPKYFEYRVLEKGGIRPAMSMYSRVPYDLIDHKNLEHIDEIIKQLEN